MLLYFLALCFSTKVPRADVIGFNHNLYLLDQLDSTFGLSEIEKDYFKWFLFTTEEPHPSDNPLALLHAIRLTQQLIKLGAEAVLNVTSENVIGKFKASPGRESARTVLLLAHYDQVDTRIELQDLGILSQPIYLVLNGNKLEGFNSSTGADGNGGVALILTLLEYEESFQHGPIEIIFSANEETSMSGVWNLTGKEFKASYLLNIEGIDNRGITNKLPGVHSGSFKLSLTFQTTSTYSHRFLINFAGFHGGHSGLNALLNTSNAFKVALEFLHRLEGEGKNYEIVSFNGGFAHNVIPSDMSFEILTDENQGYLGSVLNQIFDIVHNNDYNYPGHIKYDSAATFTITPSAITNNVVYIENKGDVIHLLDTLNYSLDGRVGYISYNTTYNIGSVQKVGDKLIVLANVRSFVHELVYSFGDICQDSTNFPNLECEILDPIPEWISPSEAFAERIQSVINKTVPDAIIVAAPGNAENSVIAVKYPHLDSVVLGIGSFNPHRKDEYMDVPQTRQVIDFLPKILEELSKVEDDGSTSQSLQTVFILLLLVPIGFLIF